jgi:hypothetical protein
MKYDTSQILTIMLITGKNNFSTKPKAWVFCKPDAWKVSQRKMDDGRLYKSLLSLQILCPKL